MQDEDAITRLAHVPDLDGNRMQLVLGATAEQILLTGR
jgi:hypothetical protein